MLDPRARARVQAVSVRPTVQPHVTNEELADACFRGLEGKLADQTRHAYWNAVRDAIRYFHTSEGVEVPVRKWTKPEVWTYLHFAESSYCANFHQLALRVPLRAACKAGRWEGYASAEEMARANCSDCPLFRRSQQGMKRRLHALGRFFSYLARVGVVPVNFMRDVVSEWYDEEAPEPDAGERKRNPTREEVVRLVNGTPHPARRAMQACSAKWGCRPNEMLRLDRYASLGLAMPMGMRAPYGFAQGFQAHPQALPFDQGGQVVYLPERMNERGEKLPEKRHGNRWLVVDSELRPILEQYLSWWERHVQRDPQTGLPVTSAFWLTNSGTPEVADAKGRLPKDFNARWFYNDAERLGLMQPGEREDPLRRWSGHCNRHFLEQVCEMEDVPGDWSNHFRGDAFKDSRGSYFLPKPEQVQEKYHRWIPLLGFKALPDAPRMRGGASGRSETQTHRAILTAEVARLRALSSGYAHARVAQVHVGAESAWIVPQRVAGSVRYALSVGLPGQVVRVESGETLRTLRSLELARVVEHALHLLEGESGQQGQALRTA